MDEQKIEIELYVTEDGRVPFSKWFHSLKDRDARVKIRTRLDRVEIGNKGSWKSVGSGVCEMKIDCGPGYRIYFAHHGDKVVFLLLGGDKKTQKQDIIKAQEYWADYKQRFFL